MTAFTMLKNPHLQGNNDDHLHHLGFSLGDAIIESTFHDVMAVCMSGSTSRIKQFAEYLQGEIGTGQKEELRDLCSTDRYVMYKVGPVLAVSHGMGVPSITILLHELFKLLDYAKAKNVVFIRMGTCGGLGIEPGTVVVTKRAVDGLLRPYHEQIILGKVEKYETDLDSSLSSEIILSAKEAGLPFAILEGNTMCCDDFYEAQCRIDGAFCNYSKEDKLNYLKEAQAAGVLNIEMESLAVASLCKRAGVRAAVLCITMVDRLRDDEVSVSFDGNLHTRPWKIVAAFLKHRLNKNASI